MKGLVWTGELEVRDDVEVRGPRPHEVVVRIVNAGLCHSDVSVLDGTIPFPTPVVLGHEGAGVVEEVGDAVRKVQVGDHVVLTTLGSCGLCDACDRGLLLAGYAADIMIFDPDTVGPDQKVLAHDFPNGAARWTSKPQGVHATIVNGVPIELDGELQTGAGLPGQVLSPS
jgi:NADPH:quinone reductase-like Zn-dependent oxidoreductase